MFRGLYNWTLAWTRSRHATTALGVISFVESSFFPIPADVLFVPMCAARPERAMRLALIATVTSVLGGIFGWMIGHYGFELIVRPMLEFYGETAKFDALKAQADAHGTLILLTMLVTSGLAHVPPMKVVTILSGVLGFNLWLFILSAIVARGARFYALAWLMQRYGEPIVAFVERRMAWIAGGLMLLIAAAVAYLWGHG